MDPIVQEARELAAIVQKFVAEYPSDEEVSWPVPAELATNPAGRVAAMWGLVHRLGQVAAQQRAAVQNLKAGLEGHATKFGASQTPQQQAAQTSAIQAISAAEVCIMALEGSIQTMAADLNSERLPDLQWDDNNGQ